MFCGIFNAKSVGLHTPMGAILEDFRVLGILFLLLGGFGTLWVGGPVSSFENIYPSERLDYICNSKPKETVSVKIFWGKLI